MTLDETLTQYHKYLDNMGKQYNEKAMNKLLDVLLTSQAFKALVEDGGLGYDGLPRGESVITAFCMGIEVVAQFGLPEDVKEMFHG